MHTQQNIDTSSPQARRALRYCSAYSAARLGRQSAFRDIDDKGFAFAYNQSEVLDGGMYFWSCGHDFIHAYRQAVFGYWMAM